MPYTPKQTNTGSRLEVPGENLAAITDVIDLSQGSTYDLQMDIEFTFDNGWTRKTRLFGKFEKDAKGFIIDNDKEVEGAYRYLYSLGVTTFDGDALNGVCISEKGRFVHQDDTPIKDVAALIKTLVKDKLFRVYVTKDGRSGYDKILTFCEDSLFAGETISARKAAENYTWRVNNLGAGAKDTPGKAEAGDEDFLFTPGE
ncbi:MAG: hypothetical protein EOM77_06000 [Bacteroidia bacterium]|nr:hypothetical protein [Bacteroidia bacterium]